ncbi:ComF family protein [Chitinolyticbacter meiyuanensis]|uniref:ComF family protein n=1 Tax=Chitinolyticbacter meiyuanensis TaxID=682798 RepID=UPI001652A265|nr:ComF family protein [Chitinolyticbacter meiyuanensis]
MLHILNKSLEVAQRWLPASPADCLFCTTPAAAGLCPACSLALPRLPTPRCPICAQATPLAGPCGRCLAAPPAFTLTHACFRYDGWLAQLIQAAKFGQRWYALPVLTDAMLAELAPVQADLVIPVPLSAQRLAERGYNQASEIAAVLARRWKAPLAGRVLHRTRDGEHQARLSRSARLRNLRSSFKAEPLRGEVVLLVDDVMTTGATLQACAKALLRAGASRVECCVLARTLA